MADSAYCVCSDPAQANAILLHLRDDGFGQEISVFLQDQSETKDMALQENVIRGIELGSVAGALLSLTVPGLGPALTLEPVLGALNGAAAGGALGGLMGGSGALKPLGLPNDVSESLKAHYARGETVISVHSSDPDKLEHALDVFRSENGVEVFDTRKKRPH